LNRLASATTALALAALLAPPLTGPAEAQSQPAAAPQHPQSKLVPRKGSPAAAAPATPITSNGNAPDPAFGAFQRGQYVTAFGLATQRALDKKDPKSMTLVGIS